MSCVAANISASGVAAADHALNAAAQNLANQLTTSFKRVLPVFQNTTHQSVVGGYGGPQGNRQNQASPTIYTGTGVYMAGVTRDFSTGAPDITRNKYDVYIDGPGFFEVDLGNDRKAYTRMGHLKVDSSGTLRTLTDYPLTDNIQVDSTKYKNFTIREDGKVLGFDLSNNWVELGQIKLCSFINPNALEPLEDTLFTWTPDAGDPIQGTPHEDAGFGKLRQGSIELSNVTPVKELVNAVRAQQYSSANSTMMRISHEKEKDVAQKIAQVA